MEFGTEPLKPAVEAGEMVIQHRLQMDAASRRSRSPIPALCHFDEGHERTVHELIRLRNSLGESSWVSRHPTLADGIRDLEVALIPNVSYHAKGWNDIESKLLRKLHRNAIPVTALRGIGICLV